MRDRRRSSASGLVCWRSRRIAGRRHRPGFGARTAAWRSATRSGRSWTSIASSATGRRRRRAGSTSRSWPTTGVVRRRRKVWRGVVEQVETLEMPPEGEPAVAPERRERVVDLAQGGGRVVRLRRPLGARPRPAAGPPADPRRVRPDPPRPPRRRDPVGRGRRHARRRRRARALGLRQPGRGPDPPAGPDGEVLRRRRQGPRPRLRPAEEPEGPRRPARRPARPRTCPTARPPAG